MGPATERSICFFTISSPGTEFHCYVMDLSLLHTPRLSLVVGPGTDLGRCLQAGGKWAGQPSGWCMEAREEAKEGAAKDRSWLWIFTKIQNALQSHFHRTRPENPE